MSAKMTPEEFERMLAGAGPHLARIQDDKPDLSPERINALNERLNAIQPFLQELPVEQMRTLILNLLSEHPMDGSELCSRLRRANIRLKEPGAGSGAIYGILHQLEKLQWIYPEKSEIKGQFLEVYHLTENGRNKVHGSPAENASVAKCATMALAIEM